MTDPRNDEPAEEEPIAGEGAQAELSQEDEGALFTEEDDEDRQAPEGPYTSADFHNVTHKLVTHAITETLANSKLDWELVAPFLESAREMTYADFQEADIRIHTIRADGENWIEAEEAYLGFSVLDRDSGEEWMSATYWLSDLAVEEGDPKQVRRIIAAVERSLDRMRGWVERKEAGDAGEPAPPAEDDPS